jgi:hypothetical protein
MLPPQARRARRRSARSASTEVGSHRNPAGPGPSKRHPAPAALPGGCPRRCEWTLALCQSWLHRHSPSALGQGSAEFITPIPPLSPSVVEDCAGDKAPTQRNDCSTGRSRGFARQGGPAPLGWNFTPRLSRFVTVTLRAFHIGALLFDRQLLFRHAPRRLGHRRGSHQSKGRNHDEASKAHVRWTLLSSTFLRSSHIHSCPWTGRREHEPKLSANGDGNLSSKAYAAGMAF